MDEIFNRYFKESFDETGNLKNLSISYPNDFNFSYDILDELAKKNPNDVALIWCNSYGYEKTITFKEMSEMSNRVANFFVSRGVRYGDFVLVILKRNFEYWYVLNALCKIGAVVIPANSMLTVSDLKYRIEFASISAVVFTSELEIGDRVLKAVKNFSRNIKLFSVRGSVEKSEDILSNIEKYPPVIERAKTFVYDTMICYFTSGTTGLPKLVKHDFSYPLAHMITAKYWQKVVFKGLHLTVSDTGWAKASWGKIYGQWLAHSAVMVYDYDRFNPKDMLKVIEKYRVTTFCAPPTVYRFFMKEDFFDRYDISSLQYVTTAGEALNPEIIKKFKEKTGLEIMSAFGQSETVAIIFNSNKNKIGSIGRPSPFYEILLLDEKGNQVKNGEEGEISIKLTKKHQPGIFIGYHNDEKLNNFVLRDGVYHTGDIAFCDEDGYFWYVGRKDDIIKSSGYRVGPFEVESVLIEHPAVLECGVVGVPDEIRGNLIKANIVLTSKYKPSKELKKELQEFVKNKTAPYKYPRIIEFVEALPKTVSGKIKRNVLRERRSNILVKKFTPN